MRKEVCFVICKNMGGGSCFKEEWSSISCSSPLLPPQGNQDFHTAFLQVSVLYAAMMHFEDFMAQGDSKPPPLQPFPGNGLLAI